MAMRGGFRPRGPGGPGPRGSPFRPRGPPGGFDGRGPRPRGLMDMPSRGPPGPRGPRGFGPMGPRGPRPEGRGDSPNFRGARPRGPRPGPGAAPRGSAPGPGGAPRGSAPGPGGAPRGSAPGLGAAPRGSAPGPRGPASGPRGQAPAPRQEAPKQQPQTNGTIAKPKSEAEEVNMPPGLPEDPNQIVLDPYNSDLHMNIEGDGFVGWDLHKKGFEYLWAGVRSTHGAKSGKVRIT